MLSCLGKVLEWVIARWLAYITLKYRLFSPLHFDAALRCSAVNAASALTNHVEKAFQDQEVVTSLAFDIEGTFDRVADARLIKRMWEHDISLHMMRWVTSFLNYRIAAMRLDGETSDEQRVKIRVS